MLFRFLLGGSASDKTVARRATWAIEKLGCVSSRYEVNGAVTIIMSVGGLVEHDRWRVDSEFMLVIYFIFYDAHSLWFKCPAKRR